MAKMVVDGIDLAERRIGMLDRGSIRRIVEAGASAAAERMKENIQLRDHIVNSDMMDATMPGDYREYLGYGAVDVYPQGRDRKGVRNATKAYVINYGRGKAKGKLGDKFITDDEPKAEEAVRAAMQAESDRIVAESAT